MRRVSAGNPLPPVGHRPSGPSVPAPSTTMVLLLCEQLGWPMLRTLCWPRQSLFIRGRGRWPRCLLQRRSTCAFSLLCPRPLWPTAAHWWTGIHIQRYRKAIIDTREILCKRYRTYNCYADVKWRFLAGVEGTSMRLGVLLAFFGLLVLVSIFTLQRLPRAAESGEASSTITLAPIPSTIWI